MQRQSGNADLKHRDWCLFTQKKLIQLTTPQVSVRIIDTKDGGKRLLVLNVTEAQIASMKFLTNTDQNNNYLYLENMRVRLRDSIEPLEIQGLKDILINMYQLSDMKGYLSDSKTHIPFDPVAFNGESLGQFIDSLTSQLPYEPNTSSNEKVYDLVLNPDIIGGALLILGKHTTGYEAIDDSTKYWYMEENIENYIGNTIENKI